MKHLERKKILAEAGYRKIINFKSGSCHDCRHSDSERNVLEHPLLWCNKFMTRVSQMNMCERYERKKN